MSGGLLDLVSKGCNDINILNPEITFFKSVYIAHNPFIIQPIMQKFISTVDFNKRSTCKLSLNGDLINKICLVIELPEIHSKVLFAWKKNIGFNIIDNIEIEIGGQLIDKHYGAWLNIWYELTKGNYQKYNNLINNKILTSYTYYKPGYKLFIPLQFWFNKNIGLSLPIMCMQNNIININLNLEKIENCIKLLSCIKMHESFLCFKKGDKIYQGDIVNKFFHFDNIQRLLYYENNTDFVKDICIFNKRGKYYPKYEVYDKNRFDFNIKIKNAFLLVDYVFLDNNERKKFINNDHEYLIEQIFFDEKYVNNNEAINLDFKYLCKQVIWVLPKYLVNDNIKGKILFNDNDGITERNYNYFNSVQAYQYFNNTFSKGIYSYCFSYDPLNYNPLGYINLNNVKLSFKINIPNVKPYTLKCYSISYNLFRVNNNACGTVFNKYN